jgi:hypothetical protein
MNQQLMQKVQRSSSDSVWTLADRASMTLRVGPGPRVVQVRSGRLWLTSNGDANEASVDVWLQPGEGLELPAGMEVVVEAWSNARFQLLVPPAACRARTSGAAPAQRLGDWLRRQLPGLAWPVLQPVRR